MTLDIKCVILIMTSFHVLLVCKCTYNLATNFTSFVKGIFSMIGFMRQRDDGPRRDVVGQVLLDHLVLAGVVTVDGLLVFAHVVADGALVVVGRDLLQVLLDPGPVVLHGQVVLPLPGLVLGLGLVAADLARPPGGTPVRQSEARFGAGGGR